MEDPPNPPISTSDRSSVSVRGVDLTTELMGEMDFGGAVYLLLSGSRPTEAERQLTNAMLCSLMVHGLTPHALASRLTTLSEPHTTQAAIASGLLGVGSRFAGAMQECSAALQTCVDSDVPEQRAVEMVSEYRERGETFPGLGHPEFDPVDPRSERLFELAEEGDVAGEHVAVLRTIQRTLEADVGVGLPINVTGAIAALTADMGLPPEAARGIAVMSRAAGLTAEVLEEHESPLAADVLEYASERRLETDHN